MVYGNSLTEMVVGVADRAGANLTERNRLVDDEVGSEEAGDLLQMESYFICLIFQKKEVS